MQPKLALVYNSNADNGILGQGWYLSGIPAITRIHNGDGIKYAQGDSFAITTLGVKPDWQQRLWEDNTYAGFSDFRRYVDDFVRYRAQCLWAYVGYCEPGSFVATDASGLKMEFGNMADSLVADGPSVGAGYTGGSQFRVFALNKVTDLQGNSYQISYIRPSGTGEIYPDTIRYTVAAGITKYHTVQFIYENRADVSIDHLGASAYRTVYQTKRLKWIEVHSDGVLVRKYKMFYGHTGTTGKLVDADTYAPSTGRSRLTAVQEYGTEGWGEPAQTFGYQDGTLPTVNMEQTIGYACTMNTRVAVADFNGDGFDDLLCSDGRNIYSGLSNGISFAPFTIIATVDPHFYLKAADVDGDGKADLIFDKIVWENSTPGTFFRGNLANIVVAFSNGIGIARYYTIGAELWRGGGYWHR